MLFLETNSGAILVNIKDLYKNGMWNGMTIPKNKSNCCPCYMANVIDFIVSVGFIKILKFPSDIGTRILTNLDKAYFLIRPDDKETRKYYIKNGLNCKDYDIKQGRKNGYYLMGVIITRNDLDYIGGGEGVIIDWIQSYYPNTDTAKSMINILETYYRIALIPIDISPNPDFWKAYLKKHFEVNNLDDFIKYLWENCEDINNYYYIAYYVRGYYKILDETKENVFLRLLYDY